MEEVDLDLAEGMGDEDTYAAVSVHKALRDALTSPPARRLVCYYGCRRHLSIRFHASASELHSKPILGC